MKANASTIALGLTVLSAVAYVGTIKPLSASLLKARTALSDAEIRQTAVELAVSQRPDIERRIGELEKTNAVRRATWLSPMLNSYAMRAKALLDAPAAECDLKSVSYEEGDLRALPVPHGGVPTRRTARRSVRVRALADYAAAVSFLMRIERDLPTMTLQSMSMRPQSNGVSRDQQEVEMVIEWPGEGEVLK